MMINDEKFLLIFNFASITANIADANHYLRQSTQFFSCFTTLHAIAPKYTSTGIVDNRRLFFVGPDNAILGLFRLGIIVLTAPLTSLQSAVTAPGITIPFSGFKT